MSTTTERYVQSLEVPHETELFGADYVKDRNVGLSSLFSALGLDATLLHQWLSV